MPDRLESSQCMEKLNGKNEFIYKVKNINGKLQYVIIVKTQKQVSDQS